MSRADGVVDDMHVCMYVCMYVCIYVYCSPSYKDEAMSVEGGWGLHVSC